jgi:hypothetical protein
MKYGARSMKEQAKGRSLCDEALAVIMTTENREKQPHDVSGGIREHRTRGGADR